MIFVDDLQLRGVWRYGRSAHLMPESHRQKDIDELHRFAQSLGLRREWFQNKGRWPHYDVTGMKRLTALCMGAVPCSTKEYIRSFKHYGDARGLLTAR